MTRNKRSQGIRKRVGCCESCGIAIPPVLHVHHCKIERDRNDFSDGGYIVLCANCHYILHHCIGWDKDFSETVGKMDSIKILRNKLAEYNDGEYGQYLFEW